jgi:hypothetical protein
MAEQLAQLPPQRRKVVVLVGRHLNEGSVNLANRCHESWGKKGAVTIQLPVDWTPEGFWHSAMQRNLTAEEVENEAKAIPSDEAILDFLFKRGFRIPVLNIHGAGHEARDITNSSAETAENREKIETERTPTTSITTGNKTRIFEHKLIRHHYGNIEHPNEILIEIYYGGSKRNTKSLEYAVGLDPHSRLAVNNSPSYIAKRYLRGIVINRGSLERLHKDVTPKIEELIEHLSKTGLKARLGKRDYIR